MNKHSPVTLVISAFFLLASFPANAQFRYYTTDQGLPSNTVRSLLQDSDGFVWAGTSSGLCWCNGNEFTLCDPPEGEEWGKSVFDICESKETGTLWVGTFEGLYYMHKDQRRLSRLKSVGNEGPSEDCSINRIVADDNHNIWVGTIEQGLFRYSIPNGKWVSYLDKGPGKSINDILVTSDQQIWVVCLDDSIYKYNTAADDFTAYPVVDRFSKRKMQSGTCLCQDTFGDLWVCDSNCDLWRVDRNDMLCVSAKVQSRNEKLTSRTILEFSPGEILIGTNLGMLSFDTARREYSWMDRGGKIIGQLNDKFVYALMKDNAGGLWVGTYFGGINYKSANTSIVKSIYPGDACGNIISVMAEIDGGKLLIGSDDGGLSVYDPLSGAYTRLDIDRNNSNMNIHALLVEKDDVWVGTFENGLYKIDRKSGGVRHYDGKFMEEGLVDVYSIFRDSHGTLWIGTTSGIGILDEGAGRFRRMINLESRSDIVRILQDGNSLYFATEKNGLIKYSYANQSFDTVPGDYPKHVSSVEIYEGELYAGTSNGVYTMDKEGKLLHYDHPLLRNVRVSGMVSDYCGLWISTDKGIFCFDTGAKIVRFTAEDGFLSDRFNIGSILKLSDGRIFVGSAKGINAFVPSLLKNGSHSEEPRVVLKRVGAMVDGGEMSVFPVTENGFEIKASRASLSFDFIALNYESQKNNVYRYRLVGYEDKWHEASSEDIAAGVLYSNIKPSIYTFKVQAARISGASFGPYSSLRIKIIPPARLIIIYSLVALLLIGIIIVLLTLMYRYRKQKKLAIQKREDYILQTASKTQYADRLAKIREYAEHTSFNPALAGKSMQAIVEMAGSPGLSSENGNLVNAEVVIRSICEVLGGKLDYSFSGNRSAMVRSSEIILPLCSAAEEALKKGGNVLIQADASMEKVEIMLISEDGPTERMSALVYDNARAGESRFSGPIADLCAKDKFCSELLSAVMAHLSDENLSIDFIAESMRVCRATIFSKVKSVTGLTPNILIRKIRLEKAAEMLCRPNFRVSEACAKTGFTSISYFGKLFKEEYGKTPKEFASLYKDMETYYKTK